VHNGPRTTLCIHSAQRRNVSVRVPVALFYTSVRARYMFFCAVLHHCADCCLDGKGFPPKWHRTATHSLTFSPDLKRFVVKTMNKSEHRFLLRILEDYARYMTVPTPPWPVLVCVLWLLSCPCFGVGHSTIMVCRCSRYLFRAKWSHIQCMHLFRRIPIPSSPIFWGCTPVKSTPR
jgi:hypothetical protein